MVRAQIGDPTAPGGLDVGRDGSVAAITRRLDPLPINRLHVAILALSTLGLFTDIAEVALSNALAAIFLAPPHSLPRGSLSLLLASVFAGGAVGAPVFGLLGDRLGRRRALQMSLGLMAIGSVAAAMSPGLTSLTIARAVSGFAIGGFPPLIATYLAEVMPPRRRGAMLMVCAGIGFLGGSAVILLIQALAPAAPLGIEPWRWALILGAVLAALGGRRCSRACRNHRTGSPRSGRAAEADRACRRFESRRAGEAGRRSGRRAPGAAPAGAGRDRRAPDGAAR